MLTNIETNALLKYLTLVFILIAKVRILKLTPSFLEIFQYFPNKWKDKVT